MIINILLLALYILCTYKLQMSVVKHLGTKVQDQNPGKFMMFIRHAFVAIALPIIACLILGKLLNGMFETIIEKD